MSNAPTTDAVHKRWEGQTVRYGERWDHAATLEKALREILSRPMYHPRHGRPSDSKWCTLNLRTSDVERYRKLLEAR